MIRYQCEKCGTYIEEPDDNMIAVAIHRRPVAADVTDRMMHFHWECWHAMLTYEGT